MDYTSDSGANRNTRDHRRPARKQFKTDKTCSDRSTERNTRDDRGPAPKRSRPDESAKNDKIAAPAIKKPVVDPLQTRTGGAYIPPAKLRMMQAEISDKSSAAFQRLAWEALKKSINGLVNKVNVSNIGVIVRELLKENVVRGRGILCQSLMQAQSFSLTFTHVYAALVAVLNSKFPQIGLLLLNRLIIQFRRGIRRNDKSICLSSSRFIAHLMNQQVAHEVVALEILTFLLEKVQDATDDSELGDKSRNSCAELAAAFLRECGQKLQELSPRCMVRIFESLKNIINEGKLEERVKYMFEAIWTEGRNGFKDNPAILEELDLVEEDDQVTHVAELDGKLDSEDILNVFKHDPEFEVNEEKYKEIRASLLGESSDGEDGEDGSESSGSDSDDEEDEDKENAGQDILDQTESNMLAFRRTIYLTLRSSLTVDEATHKILKGNIKPGWEMELGNKLQGQVIWITGASRGIGEAYAIVLAKSGAKLALSARDEQRLQQVKQKCLDAGAREEDILLVPLDMVKYEDHEQAFNKVLQYFGKVSVLLNNAGRSQRARWDDIELSVDKELFELNVFSLVALARRVNKYFRTVGGGHHVVTSSTLGKFGGPNSASYTASKHALHVCVGYFESLRVEGLKDNISVTMLCPGPVESELLQHAFTEKLGQVLLVIIKFEVHTS
ncbi:hypothetical protein HAZT_HAZT008007 [Hyalella azteca]|uniref:MIF4G domain-containing protein n=1 Tax=Hyalella azteca TaxID=294128 RepID=A0A6A0GZL1_HYAAZ|nr:hypothetical protein HAZT_HAZT008007 [Hyalella azteca]